jgi:hypothetical protein
MRRRNAWILLGLATVVAFGARAWPGAETLAGDAVRPFADDPPYHLMRVQSLLAGDVDPSAPDPRVAWPEGATACWPWGFDRLLAGVARVAGARGPDAVARGLAWVPPALGAVLVPLTYLLAVAWTGRRRALWAAATVALLPAHVGYALLGRVDHHVVEPLFLVLSLAGPGWVLAGRIRGGRGAAVASALSGLALGASFAFYPAALPWAGLALVVAGVPLALRAPASGTAFAGAAFAGTLAALAQSPWPDAWVFYSPSRVHLALIGAASSGLAVASAARAAGMSPLRGALAGGAAGLAALAAVAALAPGFRAAVWGGTDYLAAGSFTGLSLEARPLVADPARTARLVTGLLPLALAGILVRILGAPCPWDRPADAGLPPVGADRWLGWAMLGALVLAMAQRRFLVAATPLLAIALVDGVAIAGGMLARGLGAAGVRIGVARGLQAALVLLGAMPAIGHLLELAPLTPTDRAMYRAAEVVRAHAGAAAGGSGAAAGGSGAAAGGSGAAAGGSGAQAAGVGALVPWGHGHLFQWAAGVGTVCDNFFGVPQSDRAMARCLEMAYRDDPAAVPAMLAEARLGYVVLVPPHPERIRVEAALMGRPADAWVDAADRLTPAFARTFQAVAGMWGAQAVPGQAGPWGLVLLDRIEEADADGEIVAQVLVFQVPRATAAP